jgi:hypothetical protein
MGEPCSATTPRSLGYLSPLYAHSLAEFGRIIKLPASGGWLLGRPIAGSRHLDAMHGYPLLVCRRWAELESDLDSLSAEVVSITVVTDPFAEYAPGLLQRAFPDLCQKYKDHFITDLGVADEEFVNAHHRRNAEKAFSRLGVCMAQPTAVLYDEWLRLYDNLIVRHGITGISRFSPKAFRRQFDVPGCVVLAAHDGDTVVGMHLWYEVDQVAYYHLGACSDRGYDLRASFALFAYALTTFRERGVRFLALGGGAGISGASDGLTRFKRGWSNGTRPVYLCGRICMRDEYARLAGLARERIAAGALPVLAGYFPSYRADEALGANA